MSLSLGFACLLLSACTPPATSYRLLSDDVIGRVKSPPYSLEQVRLAQSSLRWRISNRIRGVTVQSELKSFACLIVSQHLDPTSARGERAPTRIPCVARPSSLCSHGCKRSRLSHEIKLPAEYDDVARRHDEILWSDLEAIAPREESPPWERYLTDCLSCDRSLEVKRLICKRDLRGVDLTAERVDYTPLDRWLNQCEALQDPTIQALIQFRSSMRTPPEDLPYPAVIPHLDSPRQARLTARAALGEGSRLLIGGLDSARIKALLKSEDAQLLDQGVVTEWRPLRDRLQRRLDVELMPCLERGLEACLVAGQVRLTLRQAPHYLELCRLCEYRDVVRTWLDQVALGIEPIWHSHQDLTTQVLLKRSEPPALIIREGGQLSRLRLGRALSQRERLLWTRDLIKEESQGALTLWEPNPRWYAVSRGVAPQLLVSDRQQLYALDPLTGVTRWSYRFPFSTEGKVVPCNRIEPIPSDALGSRLSQGGALCYREDSMLFLNALGESVLSLNCPADVGCGELLTLTSNDTNPFKAKLLLVMIHPPIEGSQQAEQARGHRLTTYDLSQLDLMTAEVERREPQEAEQTRWDDVLDVSWALGETEAPALLVTKQTRQSLMISLFDPQSSRARWSVTLKRSRLLYAPSVRDTRSEPDGSGKSAVGLVTQNKVIILSLADGSLINTQRIPLKRRTPKASLAQARQTSLAWDHSAELTTILHPLNRALYRVQFTEDRSKKSRLTSLEFDRLDPSAQLTLLHDQWVISSPQYGEVFGVSPLGDRIAWTWRVPPFSSLKLGPQWALFERSTSHQLQAVFPLSSEEISRDRESAPTSPCALGDRWGCVTEGDELIDLDQTLQREERSHQVRRWFKRQVARRAEIRSRGAQAGPPAPLSPRKIEALQAQSLWGGACNWGVAGACTRLGMLAELGLISSEVGAPSSGIPKLRVALDYYRRADQLGDPLASERLGGMYEEGLGDRRDYQLARVAYQRACEASLPDACARWGRLNELGLGGPKRRATAQAAYQRACRAQVKWACDLLTSPQ